MKVAPGLSSAWMYLMLLVLLLISASQIRAQTSVLPSLENSASLPPDLKDLEADGGLTRSTKTTAVVPLFSITVENGVQTPVSVTQTRAVTSSTASGTPADTQTSLSLSTQSHEHTFSSLPASTSLDGTLSVLFLTKVPTQGITGLRHQDTPSQLNVGGKDFEGSVRRSLDPLLAGLLSVFIVTTAVIFVVLFLKFRQQNNNPEFHRLQDLPMDDLMEDTPLSRYSY